MNMVLSDGVRQTSSKKQQEMQVFDFETAAMPAEEGGLTSVPKMFELLREEATQYSASLLLSHQMQKHILMKESIKDAIASVLSAKLANEDLPEHLLFNRIMKELRENSKIVSDMVQDLIWIQEVDPAAMGYLQPFLYFKGFQAVQVQRIAHNLWQKGDQVSKMLALSLQSRAAEVFGVDAHPGAKLSHAICLDHATGVVIGETASVGHHCYILHGVTLGATGKTGEFDRHPKVGNRVKVGAGAMILGNIKLGNDVVIGAAAIVTIPIKDGDTVVGINRVLSADQRKAASEENKDLDTWLYSI